MVKHNRVHFLFSMQQKIEMCATGGSQTDLDITNTKASSVRFKIGEFFGQSAILNSVLIFPLPAGMELTGCGRDFGQKKGSRPAGMPAFGICRNPIRRPSTMSMFVFCDG
jgi:hypothetical protein